MSEISILHISDIHKAAGANLDNLHASLLRDKNNWEIEGLRCPDYIVLSGDVIQGAKKEQEIEKQYEEAADFLNKLVDSFLEGDKNRMIIVPGNHDVNRVATFGSMHDVRFSTKVLERYNKHNERLRWNMMERKFYEVDKPTKYDSRFDLFVNFYNDFFKSIGRAYPMDPINQALCLAFPKDKVCFACYNSCNELDHLNIAGEITNAAVMDAESDVRDCYNKGYLTVGVWHHNAYGDPYETGYMPKRVLDMMYQHYIRLGLFGHQHMSQTAEEYSNLLHSEDDNQRLLLVSAGSLYGGDRALHPGFRRQYNLINITLSNGSADVRVNVREDVNPNPTSFDPYFERKGSSINYTIRLRRIEEEDIIREIDKYVNTTHDYVEAYKQLTQEDLKSDFAKELKTHILKNLSSKELIKLQPVPDNADQCILYIAAANEIRDKSVIENLLKSEIFKRTIEDDPMAKEEFERLCDLLK